MKTVAIVSLKGGVGKTTLTANIGAALAERAPGEVLLVDLDPRNQLGLHFGMRPMERAGLGHALTRDAGWEQAARRGADDTLAWLPFGQLDGAELAELERHLAQRPELLSAQLAARAGAALRYAVLDVAPGPSVYFQQAVRAADLVIVALNADAASFATLPLLRAQLDAHRRGPKLAAVHLLLNNVGAAALSRDVRTLIEAQREWVALPFVVHQDEAVREALAAQRPVAEWARAAQAAVDFRQAAEWIGAELGDDEAATRDRSVARVADAAPVASASS